VQKEKVVVASETESWATAQANLPDLLRSKHLYKGLSLVLAGIAGINIPPSLLLLSLATEHINVFAKTYGLPLMIRVDYPRRPRPKPIGGIPIYALDTVLRVSRDVLQNGLMPLFHPHLDRFEDLFSVGVLINPESNEVEVETVGKGFDAGDLRLGKVRPHETFRMDLATAEIEGQRIISDESYRGERSERMSYVHRLKHYIGFVNTSATLLADLDQFGTDPPGTDAAKEIPVHYHQMPEHLRRELSTLASKIKSGVIDKLPKSRIYVASLSYLIPEGWVLWDIYGDWYWR
jgi:hypothetical protein